MFARYNVDEFPIVKVQMNDVPKSNYDFYLFLKKWEILYKNKKDFSFIFDTRNVGVPHIKYSIAMCNFIKKLKKEPYHYLQESIILINNNKIKWLLEFIFTIQSPVAPVYIYNTDTDLDSIKRDEIKKNKETIIIYPNKSLVSFL